MKPFGDMRARRVALALGACGLAGTPAAAAAASPAPTPTGGGATPAGAPAPAKSKPAAPAKSRPTKRSRSKVTLDDRRLDVRAGATASVGGRVHARSPQLVRLQGRTLAGRWQTLAKDRPDARGRFHLAHRTDEPGSRRVRVRYSGDQRNLHTTRSAGRLNAFRQTRASWYGPGFYGRRTACGGTFSADVLGVAHKTLPCGTRLTLRKGERTVRVRVIDRGPFAGGRELDLSPAVKHALRFGSTGSVGTTS